LLQKAHSLCFSYSLNKGARSFISKNSYKSAPWKYERIFLNLILLK
jgi:hypothetical protein